MGFEPQQRPLKVEAVNKFADCMKDTLSKAHSALTKAKDNMAWYYNQQRTPAPTFIAGDKVFLDALDIRMTHPSKKLSHHYLRPFEVIHPVGMHAYQLRLPASMSRIHPVFHIIKLLPNPPDLIGQTVCEHPAPMIIGGEEHYEVGKVLDSRLMRGRLEFLVSWKGYGYEENSWVSEHDVSAP
jgi:hypothetical protein